MDKNQLSQLRRHHAVLDEMRDYAWSRWVNGQNRETIHHERAQALDYAVKVLSDAIDIAPPKEEPAKATTA